MKAKAIKGKMIFARVDDKTLAELEETAEQLDRPASQIVRDGLKRELKRIKREERT